jgi:hypothetical protein
MTHAIGGNSGVFSFAGGNVGRLQRWRATETLRTFEDTAAGDLADAITPLRKSWNVECQGWLTSIIQIPGGISGGSSLVGVPVALVGELSPGDGPAFAGTGLFTELEVDNGGVDGGAGFTARGVCSEATPAVWG